MPNPRPRLGYASRTLGHANPSITLTIYAHEFGRAEHAERARATMDAALGSQLSRSAGHIDWRTLRRLVIGSGPHFFSRS